MSLSNLTLNGMNDYGGIEIKKNAEKNTYLGFIYSVILHGLLILLYCGWTWISKEDDKRPIIYRDHGDFRVDPPPSILPDIPTSFPSIPKMDIAKPTFDIPVPIPDIQAPSLTMPTNDNPIPTSEHGTSTIANTDHVERNNVEVLHVPEIKEAEPSENDFILDITEEPNPIQNIQSLMQYPETARQANLEGRVTFSALIGKDGRVERVAIDKADYKVFMQPVIDAVLKVRFTPARQNQTPVRVWYSQTVSFKLH
jgi:TonB family protein